MFSHFYQEENTLIYFILFQIGVATFSTYIFVSANHRLDAQTAFVAISLFDILRGNLNHLPWLITDLIKVIYNFYCYDNHLSKYKWNNLEMQAHSLQTSPQYLKEGALNTTQAKTDTHIIAIR